MTRSVPPIGEYKEGLPSILDWHRHVVVWMLRGPDGERLRGLVVCARARSG